MMRINKLQRRGSLKKEKQEHKGKQMQKFLQEETNFIAKFQTNLTHWNVN